MILCKKIFRYSVHFFITEEAENINEQPTDLDSKVYFHKTKNKIKNYLKRENYTNLNSWNAKLEESNKSYD